MQNHRQPESASRRTGSQSVGSLPGPFGFEVSSFAGSRVLAGRWQQALRAERALGWVLWTALAAVLFLVSQ